MQYIIKTENGFELVNGGSSTEVKERLLENGIIPVLVIPFPFNLLKMKSNAGLTDKECKDLFFQLAGLVRSTGSIVTSVNLLYNKIDETQNTAFTYRSKIKNIIKHAAAYYYKDKFKKYIGFLKALRQNISEGAFMSATFIEYRFDEVAISLLKSAEKTGDLSGGFLKCSEYFESKRKYRNSILNTLAYPGLLFSLLYAAFLVFLFYVIPEFAKFFKQFPHMPASTVFVINTFAFLKNTYFYYTGLFAVLVLTFFYFFILNKNNARTKFFNALAQIPIAGALFQFEFLRYFMYEFSLFISSGTDIMQIIKFLKENTINDFYKSKLEIVYLHVITGYSLTESFNIAGFLRPQDIYYLDSAEKSGDLEAATMELSKTYGELFEFEMKIFKNALTIISVALVVVFILIIFLSVYLPLIKGMISLTGQ